MTNASDPKWVAEGLSFWEGEAKAHPRSQKIKAQLEQFRSWARQLGLIQGRQGAWKAGDEVLY